jgi:hypothetical protein
MEETTPQGSSKKKRMRGWQKTVGGKPIFTIISVFVIVILCLLLSFSKETIQHYQDAFVKKGQDLLGLSGAGPCEAGWSFYEQDVIGVSFCYPQEWGKVILEPKNPVTRLTGLLDEFGEEGSSSRNRFSLRFEENPKISFNFFNDKYGGEFYPNSYAEKYGYVDNIDKLKGSAKVCEYKLDFNHTWEYEGRINETFAECDGTVKTAIIDRQEYFEKEVHSAQLKSFAFRKLQNGYFDNLLISYTYGSTMQSEEKFANIPALLGTISVSPEDYARQQSDFRKLVAGMKTFLPPKAPEPVFLESEADDARTYPIRRYYYLIQAGKLSEAYLLKAEEGRESYEEFVKHYKDAYMAAPYGFQDKGGDSFYFFFDYEDHNEPKETYGVQMTVKSLGR